MNEPTCTFCGEIIHHNQRRLYLRFQGSGVVHAKCGVRCGVCGDWIHINDKQHVCSHPRDKPSSTAIWLTTVASMLSS